MSLLTLNTEQLQGYVHQQCGALAHCAGLPDIIYPPKLRIDSPAETPKEQRTWAGYFSPYGNTIGIYASVFDNLEGAILHRALEATLLHEIAHFFQRRLHKPRTIAPHGKEFRVIAYAINAHFGRDVVTLYHNLPLTPEGEAAAALTRKARALLALAHGSTNSHEAELAAARFAELTTRYNLALDATAALSTLPPVERQTIATYRRMDSWRQILAAGVAHSFACEVVYQSATTFDPAQIEFIGRPRAIDQAIDLYLYLEEAVERLVDANRPAHRGAGRAFWASYRLGVARTLRTRLEAQTEQQRSEGLPATEDGGAPIPALVLRTTLEREEAATEQALKTYYPRLRSARAVRCSSNEGYRQGGVAGRSISLARQMRGGATRQLTGAAS